MPTAREIGVQSQRTIDQSHHGANVLSEIRQRHGRVRQHGRIIARHREGSSSEIAALKTVCLAIFAPTIEQLPEAAHRGPRERRPVISIALDSSLE